MCQRCKPLEIKGIVTHSAEHRQIIFDIDPLWETYPEADARYTVMVWSIKRQGIESRMKARPNRREHSVLRFLDLSFGYTKPAATR